MLKKCATCKLEKSTFLFKEDKKKKDGLSSRCRECISIYQKEWNCLHQELRKQRSKDYYKMHKEHCNIATNLYYLNHKDSINNMNSQKYKQNKSQAKNADLKKRYGITLEDYNKLFLAQAGHCKICQKHQTEFKIALCVDHCHKTGQIRGLLCNNCNRGLGLLEDSILNMESAIEYLKLSNTFSIGVLYVQKT